MAPRRPPGLELAFSAFSTFSGDTANINTNGKHMNAYANANATSPTATLSLKSGYRSAISAGPFSAMSGATKFGCSGVRTPRLKTPLNSAYISGSTGCTMKTPLSSLNCEFDDCPALGGAVDSDGGDTLPRGYFDEYVVGEYELEREQEQEREQEPEFDPPPLLTWKERIIPLPPASPCSAFEMWPSSRPVSSVSPWEEPECKGDDLIRDHDAFDCDYDCETGISSRKWLSNAELEAPLSPLWNGDGGGGGDVPFTRGLFGRFWDVDSSSSFSSSSSSSSSSSDDGFSDSDSDSDSDYSENPLDYHSTNLGAWCRESLLFCDSFYLSSPRFLVDSDNNNNYDYYDVDKLQ